MSPALSKRVSVTFRYSVTVVRSVSVAVRNSAFFETGTRTSLLARAWRAFAGDVRAAGCFAGDLRGACAPRTSGATRSKDETVRNRCIWNSGTDAKRTGDAPDVGTRDPIHSHTAVHSAVRLPTFEEGLFKRLRRLAVPWISPSTRTRED